MWTAEHAVETSATQEQIWQAWRDVPRWPEWNHDLERAELSGPFAAGSTIMMRPHGDEPIELLIADAREPELFVDEARLGATVVRTIHRVEAGHDGRRRVVYRMEIDGPDGETIGPAISGDFPEVLAGLVARWEG
jgi:Polyketide cyclase / dehydrase and lipid transport